jgi:uncharacterized membrane protein YvbJ
VFCNRCGTELSDDSRFCRKCGHAFAGLTAAVTRPADRKCHIQTFVAVAAIIAGVIILLALPYNGYFWDHSGEAVLGVIVLAGGLTYFWRRYGKV